MHINFSQFNDDNDNHINIHKTCEDLRALIIENSHAFQVLTYRYSALLYAIAPDLDQLSELEAQLK